jgi:type 1 glutamine amidotransferase
VTRSRRRASRRRTVAVGLGAAVAVAALTAITAAVVGGAATGPISLTRLVVAATGPPNPWMKSIADLNGDGRPDLIVSGATGPVVWYRNPTWKPTTISARADSQSGSATADIDGDGDQDVVIGTTWYENAGRGTAWTPHVLGEGGTHDVVVADLDGDGKLDVAMRGETASVIDLFFQEDRAGWTHVKLDPGSGRNGLDVGDLNGDGRPDLAIGGKWLANPGGAEARVSGAWSVHTFARWNPWASVKIADLNGDGRNDIVLGVSEQHGPLAWFEAPGAFADGTWQRHAVGSGLDSVHSVSVADMNRDGRPDIVASEFRGAGRLIVFRNLGHALSWSALTVARGQDLHNTRVADVDGDGIPDIFGAAPFGKQPVLLYRSRRVPAALARGVATRRILVFSKTLGFRHASIPHAISKLVALGAAHGFAVDATEDSGAFTPENLARYRAVVFLNPSGDVLDADQRDAFKRYIEAGHGFVGIHNATALVLEDWPWYTGLVGARFKSEISTQPLRLIPVVRSNISTRGIPDPWLITEEAYNWTFNPKTRGVTVLVELDERYSKGGTMGRDHPFSWYHRYDGGRSWYTNAGANSRDYDNRVLMGHILGGIRWAGGF